MATKKKEIKILLPVANRFKLSASVGQVIKMEVKQANEMVKLGYAEIPKVDPPKEDPPKEDQK